MYVPQTHSQLTTSVTQQSLKARAFCMEAPTPRRTNCGIHMAAARVAVEGATTVAVATAAATMAAKVDGGSGNGGVGNSGGRKAAAMKVVEI